MPLPPVFAPDSLLMDSSLLSQVCLILMMQIPSSFPHPLHLCLHLRPRLTETRRLPQEASLPNYIEATILSSCLHSWNCLFCTHGTSSADGAEHCALDSLHSIYLWEGSNPDSSPPPHACPPTSPSPTYACLETPSEVAKPNCIFWGGAYSIGPQISDQVCTHPKLSEPTKVNHHCLRWRLCVGVVSPF